MKIDKGMVAVFDILGYRGLTYGNDTAAVAEIITQIIQALPAKATSAIVSSVSPKETAEWVKEQIGTIEVRVFADNFLLVLPIDESLAASAKARILPVFLSYAAMLMRVAFDDGIPLRGAISHGEFFLSDQCFAGRTILECHEGAELLQLAGCAIMPETANYFEEVARSSGADLRFQRFIFPFCVPLKNGTAKVLPMLDWYLPMEDWGAHRQDLRSYIIDAFQAHNKDVAKDVVPKLQNTELMLRRAIQRKAH